MPLAPVEKASPSPEQLIVSTVHFLLNAINTAPPEADGCMRVNHMKQDLHAMLQGEETLSDVGLHELQLLHVLDNQDWAKEIAFAIDEHYPKRST